MKQQLPIIVFDKLYISLGGANREQSDAETIGLVVRPGYMKYKTTLGGISSQNTHSSGIRKYEFEKQCET